MRDHEGQLPTPAEFIRKELEARGLSQRDLAFVLGVPDQAVNQLALGRRGVSAEMAKALGLIFGHDPAFILRLQKAAEVPAELARAKEPDASIQRKAELLARCPVRELVKRGWVEPDPQTLEAELAAFLQHVGEPGESFAHAGKKTNYDGTPPAQLAWLLRAREMAEEMVVPKFAAQGLRDALPKLSALMTAPEETRHVPRLLNELGVRYVIVEGLPGAKIDGACFWVAQGKSPVVAMSLRFDRIDNFWFVLRHELEHVLNRDGVDRAIIDADLEGEGSADGISEQEMKANAAASDFCVKNSEMESWIARKHPFYSERDLIGFARRIGVHPGIVAGQLRNRTKNYKLFAKYLEKVRPCVAPSALVDGWGQIAPVTRQGVHP